MQLLPNTEGISTLRRRHEDEMKKRIRLARTTAADKDNALANAGVLSTLDDREFASRRPPIPSQVAIAPAANTVKVYKESKVMEEINQYRDLALALLSVGAIRPALFILTREEWLISRYPQLADILLNHLEYAVMPIYRNLSSSADIATTDLYSAARQRADGNKEPKIKLTMTFPVPPATSDLKQVFFFQHWMDRIPLCPDTSTLHCIVSAYLKIIGIHAYRSLPLFIKLCRIARSECQSQVRFYQKKQLYFTKY
jgi:THO complex subunit 2